MHRSSASASVPRSCTETRLQLSLKQTSDLDRQGDPTHAGSLGLHDILQLQASRAPTAALLLSMLSIDAHESRRGIAPNCHSIAAEHLYMLWQAARKCEHPRPLVVQLSASPGTVVCALPVPHKAGAHYSGEDRGERHDLCLATCCLSMRCRVHCTKAAPAWS